MLASSKGNLLLRYIHKSADVYKTFIRNAYENKESKEVVDSFLDILDYNETKLDLQSYLYVIYSNAENFLKDSLFVQILEVILFNLDFY